MRNAAIMTTQNSTRKQYYKVLIEQVYNIQGEQESILFDLITYPSHTTLQNDHDFSFKRHNIKL